MTRILPVAITILFLFLIARAESYERSHHAPAAPAAVNSVAPDDEGTDALSSLDFSTK